MATSLGFSEDALTVGKIDAWPLRGDSPDVLAFSESLILEWREGERRKPCREKGRGEEKDCEASGKSIRPVSECDEKKVWSTRIESKSTPVSVG